MTDTAADSESKEIRQLRRKIQALRIGGDTLDLFGDPIPADLLTEYPADDLDSQLSRSIQKKYRTRPKNIRRCWNRVQLFLPELMDHDLPPQRVLEMSTAHGAMLEVLRHFGHDVIGIDYANMASSAGNQSSAAHRDLNDENFTRTRDDYGIEITEDQRSRPEWPYRKITESIDLPMRIFDAGKTPYPCTDKEFDVLLCFQAMGRYCHPKDWSSLIDEFTRITRKTIVILLNPVRDPENTPQEYLKAYQDAKLDLRRYRRNRFACVSTFMHWGQAAGFKLTAT